MKTMMSSAFGNTDFEYSRTFDVRETFMAGSDAEDEEEVKREPLGNDLDKLDIGPDFQI